MLSKNGKHIILPTHVGKVKILYHILKAKVKFMVNPKNKLTPMVWLQTTPTKPMGKNLYLQMIIVCVSIIIIIIHLNTSIKEH